MDRDNELLKNLNKLRTSKLGVERIKRNLDLNISEDDVVNWCKTKINSADAVISRFRKHWYADAGGCIITVNAHSYTIITAHAHKEKK